MKKGSLNISLVTYNTSKDDLNRIIENSLKINNLNYFYIIDNSPTKNFPEFASSKIKYFFNNANLGYGRGHNIAINETISNNIDYHLVINPDIYFDPNIIEEILFYMNNNNNVGHLMPMVLNDNNSLQYICKLIPSPLDLLGRLFFSQKIIKKRNDKFTLRFLNYNNSIVAPYLSGCFMFLRTDALKDVGIFDERFFMYPEDIDLTRRIAKKYLTVYFPKVSVIHRHAKESFKSLKMLIIHAYNIIIYFNKWGWFFDSEREYINSKTLEQNKSFNK